MSHDRANIKHSSFLAIILIFTVVFSTNSPAEYNLIEFTHATTANVFEKVSTIGLHSTLGRRHGEESYGGIQISYYEHIDSTIRDSVVRVFFGQSIEGLISPFFEVGTDLFGFLTALSNNNNDQNCQDGRDCSIDLFFRVGARVRLHNRFTLGIFHENIDFGNYHSNLEGEHNYTGASLGFKF